MRRPEEAADAEVEGDVRPQGRRRHDLQGHARRAVQRVPGQARLRGLHAAAGRRSSRTRRRSARSRSATARSSSTRGTTTTQIKLSRFDNYKGEQAQGQGRQPQALPEPGRGLRRPAEQQPGLPAAGADGIALAGDKWKTDLQDRTVEREVGVWQAFAFPLYDKKFANVKFRQAISMAIDRKLITEKIFAGSRTAGHRLRLPGRRRLQGRPVRRVLHVRRCQGQGRARGGRRLQG